MMAENFDRDLFMQVKRDLTLTLLYLNGFRERDFEDYLRSWKGYDFGDINLLAEEGYISEGRRAKSVVLYEEGIERAKKLLEKYGFNEIVDANDKL